MNTDPSWLRLVARLLSRPQDVVDAADDPATRASLVPRLLVVTAVGAALFGVAVGSYRGGLQVPLAAMKMPVLLLAPLLITLPAVRALVLASGNRVDRPPVRVSWGRTGTAGLVGMARTAVLAAALGPLLWLPYSVGMDYHGAVMALALSLVVAGVPGIATAMRTVAPAGTLGLGSRLALVAMVGLVTAQTGWLLRPWVVRPQGEVTVFRAMEDDVVSSLSATRQASQGQYQDWEPAGDGLLGELQAPEEAR